MYGVAAAYFAVEGLYPAAIAGGFATVIAALAARMARSAGKGGPSMLLACIYLAALVGFTLFAWSALF